MEALETAGIVVVVAGAFRLLETIIGKLPIFSGNGSQSAQAEMDAVVRATAQPDPLDVATLRRIERLEDNKVSSETCAVRHKSTDEKLEVLFGKVDNQTNLLNEIHEVLFSGGRRGA